MYSQPLISIVINNYNYGRFLVAAIDSALQQTYQLVEVIVVDDGSTDDSRTIIDEYGTRLCAVYKPNGGQASAFNAGFAHSHGDIVLFLDADDVLACDIGERLVRTFAADPTLATVMCRMEVINVGGTPTGILKPPPQWPPQNGDLRRFVLTCPFDRVSVPTSGNAFAAQALRQIFPMPEESYRILADYYLIHLAPLFGHVKFLNSVGAYYRVHGKNRHERERGIFDVEQVRTAAIHATTTCRYIKQIADGLEIKGRPRRAEDLYSVSLLSMRLVSLKLDPAMHPFRDDTTWELCWAGIGAALRRFDVSSARRLMYIIWFVVLAAAPANVVMQLVRQFLFP